MTLGDALEFTTVGNPVFLLVSQTFLDQALSKYTVPDVRIFIILDQSIKEYKQSSKISILFISELENRMKSSGSSLRLYCGLNINERWKNSPKVSRIESREDWEENDPRCFSSQKEVVKEYEQLAILHGNNALKCSQGSLHAPSIMPLDLRNSQT